MKYLFSILFVSVLFSCKSSKNTVINPSTKNVYGVVDVYAKETQIPETVKPLMDLWLRDTFVKLGNDGFYYLSGTIGMEGRTTSRDLSPGLQIWRSKDLKKWEDLGIVWSLDKDATWQSEFDIVKGGPKEDLNQNLIGEKRRTLWAPELHYIKSQKTYFVVACVPENPNGNGSYILKSTSGKAEGPYVNIKDNEKGPIFPRIDGSLFEDEDSSIYFIGHNHEIAKMKPDMSGFAEPLRKFTETKYDTEPYIEGAYIVKEGGKYHLIQAIWSVKQPNGTFSYSGLNPYNNNNTREQNLYSYDVVVASADNIYGPYSQRYTVATGGGHNNFFKDKNGKWWSTMFGNPRGDLMKRPFVTRPAIFPIKYKEGRFSIDQNR
jgi:beta-xylosidase